MRGRLWAKFTITLYASFLRLHLADHGHDTTGFPIQWPIYFFPLSGTDNAAQVLNLAVGTIMSFDHNPVPRRSGNERLLAEIGAFCQRASIAESTFGRRVVNDGKLVARLRLGGRVTTHTADRVRNYIARSLMELGEDTTRFFKDAEASVGHLPAEPLLPPLPPLRAPAFKQATPEIEPSVDSGTVSASNAFRFYDNRQKYLLFVHTCSEKSVVAQRIEMELEHIKPRAPALRVFDAGVGDGTLLTRTMRNMHDRFPTVPFYIVGKQISLEDACLSLEKMPDRFYEHPATVLVITNMHFAEAPWLRPNSVAATHGMLWREAALTGNTAGQFERQIASLQAFLRESWTSNASSKTGSPVYDRPVVLVVYREDHKLLLESVRPKQGAVRADYDLIIASQPYPSRTPVQVKAQKVVAPLARALGPGGRLIGVHSCGGDPGLEIVEKIWPGEQPFNNDRHELLKYAKSALGNDARGLTFNAYADQRAVFRYEMNTTPLEISGGVGTSTLLAAWNAAVFVAQIEDQRLEQAMSDGRYIEVTREVLQKHGKLWFQNESYVISRLRYEP
jgi:SAM-dependent methyltransferase